MPLSLNPVRTWQAVLALLPAFAMFVAVLRLDRHSRRALTVVLMSLGFGCVVLGLAQAAGGSGSPLRFYGEGSAARGFFINRNHYAALLYATTPFVAAWVLGLSADRRPEFAVGAGLCLLVFTALMLGLGMAQSRAGAALAVVAGLASFALTLAGAKAEPPRTADPAPSGRTRSARPQDRDAGRTGPPGLFAAGKLIVFGLFAGVLLVLQFASVRLFQRFSADPVDDMRWQYLSVTWRAIRDHLPLGSGFGTFRELYQAYEPAELLDPTYANNAHNDYFELLLEGGMPAALLAAAFAIWFVWRATRLWRRPDRSPRSALDLALSRAASISVALLLLHSAVDYPLRSAALSVVFALCCALILPAPSTSGRVVRDASWG